MGACRAKGARAVKLKCKCGKPLGNPLTHVCVIKTDFCQRKAAAGRTPRAPAPAGDGHEHTACGDPDCPRFICKIYKEGRLDGIELGRQLGYAQGYSDAASDMSRR